MTAPSKGAESPRALGRRPTPKVAWGCGGKEQAYKVQLKSDLRDVVLAEEAYFSDHRRDADRASLGDGFAAITNDSIVVVPADSQGYAATGIPLLPEYVEAIDDDQIVLRNYAGKRFGYKQPMSDSGAIPEEFEPVMVG